MKKSELLTQINSIYKEKGLNSAYGFLKRNNIEYKRTVHEFGLQNCKRAEKEKKDFIAEQEEYTFKAHLFAIGIKSRKTGFSYNRIRAIEIKLI